MPHVTEYQIKAVKNASREATKEFKGWTRVVPQAKVKKQKRKSTKDYLRDME